MNKKVLAGAVTMALAAGPAMAADEAGFYAGIGAGQFSVDIDAADIDDQIDESEVFDENDTGVRVFGGWDFNQYFAVEAGYNSGADTSSTLGDLATDGIEADIDLNIDGIDLFLVGKLPIGETFYAFAKAGMIFWDADVDATLTIDDGEGGTITESFSGSESGEDPAYGAGFGAKIGDNVRVQAEYVQYDLDEVDVDYWSVNFIWKFR